MYSSNSRDDEGTQPLTWPQTPVISRTGTHPSRTRLDLAWHYSHGVGLAIVSEDGAWLEVNDFLCDALETSEDQLIGRQIRDFFTLPQIGEKGWTAGDATRHPAKNDCVIVRVQLRRCDSSERWLWGCCKKINESDGGGYFITFVDATSTTDSTQELRDDLVAAERTLAIVAHDIRNPLTAILLSKDILQATTKNAIEKRSIERITENASQALQIADDLIDASRWSQGKSFDLVLQATDLRTVAMRLLESYSIDHAARPIICHTYGNLEGRWDAGCLVRMLSNLLNNALTHGACDEKPVELSLRGLKNSVSIEVRNGGDAMPESMLKRIFDPLFTTKAHHPGRNLGLGLFIVKMIVEAHKGMLCARSSKAIGTVFSITLPRNTEQVQMHQQSNGECL